MKTIRSRSSRIAALIAAALMALAAAGCAGTTDTEGGSSIPWNRPEPGDNVSFVGF